MTIVQIALDRQNKKSPIQQYRDDILEGFSKDKKQIDSKYLYSEQGWNIWSQALKTTQYYVMKAQQQILQRKVSDILSSVRTQSFGFVDIGAGNGLKTIPFIQESLRRGKRVQYIAIDISQGGNQLLKDNLETQFDGLINSTLITSQFRSGLQWVHQNKQLPLFYFFIGITIGNFETQERSKFLQDVYHSMKTGDLFLITFDQKKSPQLIQKAYFNQHQLLQQWFIANINTLNTISDTKLLKQNFWSHVFYNPQNGLVEGSLVSKLDQSVVINGRQFKFEENQTIKTFRSQRYSLRQFKQIMEKVGFKYVQHFEDSNKYGMACIFTKK